MNVIPDWCKHDDKNICGFRGEYFWLSNMFPCPHKVMFRGHWFNASENAYQAAKIYINDWDKLTNCRPIESKSLYKKFKQVYNQNEWSEIKYEIMAEVLFSKFLHNKNLRLRLIETGDKYIEETNYWGDTYWGVCQGVGENNLGKILMKVRDFWR